jgi:hypothetical protein
MNEHEAKKNTEREISNIEKILTIMLAISLVIIINLMVL